MKSRSLPATALLGVTLVACSAWLAFYARGRTARAAAQVMQEEVARGNFNGVVLVSQRGRTLFQAAYGFADVDARIANSRRTRFEIGSITKSFTAVLVLQLEQQQRLSLADPVCRFLPECPTGWQAITLQHLLTHSSGIFNFTELPEFDAIRGLAQTRAQVLDRFLHRPLGFASGRKIRIQQFKLLPAWHGH